MKTIVNELIDQHRDEIIDMGNDIFQHPELGFKELRTASIVSDFLKSLDINYEDGLSVTGLKGTLGKGGINIGLIAEIDAVPTLGHEFSSEDLNAAHACGHSNQVAIMLGAVKALNNSKLLNDINGRVTLITTPAEEFTDLDFRKQLKEEGKINFLSGKQDMISKGVFDDIDIVLSCHTMGGINEKLADVNSSLNGFVFKKITYIGKTSHAGAEPHKGINALNAATIGLTAINAQRETFIDEHHVRVHGIITNGGQTVNSIPEKVVIESYVRGNSLDSILDANVKVNRAYEAGAYAVGAKCVIEDTIGYVPFKQCRDLSDVVKGNIANYIGLENIIEGKESMASGDIGDISTLMPTIQFGFAGFSGNIHGSDFKVEDPEMAYIIPAKIVATTVLDLLKDDCKLGREIIENNKPQLTKDGYINSWLKMKL